MITRIQFVGILIIALIFLFTSPVYAHGGEPRLEISVERIQPGGVIDIRGVEFEYEEAVTLYLERPGILIQAGEVIADVEGIFLHTIVLPADLPEGIYNVRAVTNHHELLSPALEVQGTAILSDGRGQGNRDEHNNLLAPIPTHAPGAVPGRASQPAAAKAPQETSLETTASPTWNIPLIISLFLFLFSIGIVIWLRQKFARRL